MMAVDHGDRVKLTERAVRARSKGKNNQPLRVDWAKRRGTVCAVGTHYVYVMWDGLKAPDQISRREIEKDNQP